MINNALEQRVIIADNRLLKLLDYWKTNSQIKNYIRYFDLVQSFRLAAINLCCSYDQELRFEKHLNNSLLCQLDTLTLELCKDNNLSDKIDQLLSSGVLQNSVPISFQSVKEVNLPKINRLNIPINPLVYQIQNPELLINRF